MRPVITALGTALLALISGSSCVAQTQSECHREVVESFGCCPTCDSECRAAITEACADIHDTPLADLELPGDSGEIEDERDEPSPDPG